MKIFNNSCLSFVLALGFILSFNSTIEAQDPHFSQFYTSPLTLNPALAGAIDDDQRFVLNYKNQWEALGTTFRTYAASYDLALMKKRLNLKS